MDSYDEEERYAERRHREEESYRRSYRGEDEGRRGRHDRHTRRNAREKKSWSSKLYDSVTSGNRGNRASSKHARRGTRKDKHRSSRILNIFQLCLFGVVCFFMWSSFRGSSPLPAAEKIRRRFSKSTHVRGSHGTQKAVHRAHRTEESSSHAVHQGEEPSANNPGSGQPQVADDIPQGGTSGEGSSNEATKNAGDEATAVSAHLDTGSSNSGHHDETESVSFADVPMNRKIGKLQVSAEAGRITKAIVRKHYRYLAKAYLATFTQGIYRHMFFDVLRRRTYALTPPGANKGVQSMMFQIIDNKVYMMDPYEVPKNSKPFYRTRINEIIWLLSRLATSGRLKNTEFMVSIHDCVQTVNKPHNYRGATYKESIPAFTIVSCNFSDNIPFPMWEGDTARGGGFAGWDARMEEYSTQSQQPWDKKEPRAVFRGGNRPSMFFRNKTDAEKACDDVGRTRLSFLGENHPGELDVSVGGSCGGKHRYLDRMNEGAQQRFKYVVYAEGNCFWADRLNKQVFGPSMIFKQETPCGQFWEPLLKPMTHYVPIDFYFGNLIEKIHWARDNERRAQDIVRNANDFANNFLTLKGIETYAEILLAEYTALLVDPDVKLERGAIDVTSKRV